MRVGNLPLDRQPRLNDATVLGGGNRATRHLGSVETPVERQQIKDKGSGEKKHFSAGRTYERFTWHYWPFKGHTVVSRETAHSDRN